ncbi:MAG: peptidyl-prolyl cis-trans isomerase [Gammaproteobacteria bacterium]
MVRPILGSAASRVAFVARALGRDRLVAYLLLGGGIALIGSIVQSQQDHLIEVDAQTVNRLTLQWASQSRKPPAPDELSHLVQSYIRDEILFREALALGFDQDDTVVRRRLIQKMEFFLGDNVLLEEPTEGQLRAYYEAHKERYLQPARFDLKHIYFAPRTDGAEVQKALDALLQNQADSAQFGDAFMWRNTYMGASVEDLAHVFGAGFAASIAALAQENTATGQWHGPVPSSYGKHLVLLESFVPEQQFSYDLAQALVAEQYQSEHLRALKEQAWQQLRSRYLVVDAGTQDLFESYRAGGAAANNRETIRNQDEKTP